MGGIGGNPERLSTVHTIMLVSELPLVIITGLVIPDQVERSTPPSGLEGL